MTTIFEEKTEGGEIVSTITLEQGKVGYIAHYKSGIKSYKCEFHHKPTVYDVLQHVKNIQRVEYNPFHQ